MTCNMETTEREKVVDIVRQWGGETSDAILEPTSQIFWAGDGEGLIGYRVEAGCAVVFGDPVAKPEDKSALALAFHKFCQEQGYQTIYVVATENFAKWGQKNLSGVLIEYGERLIIDPHKNPMELTGQHGVLVRKKVKHAKKDGLEIKEYLEKNPETDQAIEKVGEAWLEARHGPQIHISHLRLFKDTHGKRWFYAQKGKEIVGVIALNRIESHHGWLLNHLLLTPDAPHGAAEMLIVETLDKLAQEDCHYVSFGAIPAENLGELIGLGTCSQWLVKQGYGVAKKIFRLAGHKKFWEKFEPQTKKSYLLFNQKKIRLRSIVGLLKAMNAI